MASKSGRFFFIDDERRIDKNNSGISITVFGSYDEIVKINKANLVGYVCIIDRSNNNILIKEKIISQIKINIEVFKENELPDKLKKISAIKPGSRSLSDEQK